MQRKWLSHSPYACDLPEIHPGSPGQSRARPVPSLGGDSAGTSSPRAPSSEYPGRHGPGMGRNGMKTGGGVLPRASVPKCGESRLCFPPTPVILTFFSIRIPRRRAFAMLHPLWQRCWPGADHTCCSARVALEKLLYVVFLSGGVEKSYFQCFSRVLRCAGAERCKQLCCGAGLSWRQGLCFQLSKNLPFELENLKKHHRCSNISPSPQG